ncbi:MAG: PD-(D/E)XK nuclease family protein [Kofleriaceae bacterium]
MSNLRVEDHRPAGHIAEARLRWLSELVVSGSLPMRTIIVPNEATGHAWRRDIVVGEPALLLGTQFITPIGAALTLLEADTGLTFSVGEEAVRAARIAALLREDITFEHFDLTVLREGRGWGQALASTLNELERAGFDAEALGRSEIASCRDLSRILGRLDDVAGLSWTMARVLREATVRLIADPQRWPFEGPSLAEATGHEPAVLVSWLLAIPGNRIVSIATRPRRSAYLERVRARFGDLALQEIESETSSERGLLATYLFAAPDVLADPERARSAGSDGTVQLEEHAGVAEELDAAVNWIIGEVAERGTPLEHIGLVVPRLDPYAALLATRIEELLPDSVCVLGGVPATSTSAGARIAMLLGALGGYLHVASLAELLPVLDLGVEDVFLSRADAIDTMYALGTAGGSPAFPAGALEWLPRRASACVTLAREIAEASADEDRAREVRRWKRRLANLEAIVGPLEALDRVARVVIGGGGLAVLWPAVKEVVNRHLRVGVDGARISATLDDALEPLARANVFSGEDALAAIANALGAVRLPTGRFGEPRVTIATLDDAAGLTFRAVRILGLAEGIMPSSVREDAVLPDVIRRVLGDAIPRAADRGVAQQHALHRIVLGTAERVVFSVARMDAERRYREPSGAMLEAAAAIGRPPLGVYGVTIPDGELLREHSFEPAREELNRVRARWPVHASGQLDRAVRRREVPRAWTIDQMVALDLLLVPSHKGPGPMDGWLDGELPPLPGCSQERPISASALSRLLECPHRFLYERVLGWDVPPEVADEDTVDALSYGSLFHRTAEVFYRAHGPAFGEREQSLDTWKSLADVIASEEFDRFLETYPLTGEAIRSAARRRLQRDLAVLLERDWHESARFVAVERAFGPLALPAGERTIHVHGVIDRIDRTSTATLVRDLKTGRAKRRTKAKNIHPPYDVQLGLYGLVTEYNATAWDVPSTVEGAYVYPADESGEERSFRDDFADLAEHTRSWLATAADLLASQRFPRTPNPSDCTYCAFKPVCGPAAYDRASELLAPAPPELARFAALKLGTDDDE